MELQRRVASHEATRREDNETGRKKGAFFRNMKGQLSGLIENIHSAIFSIRIPLRRAAIAGALAIPLAFGACNDKNNDEQDAEVHEDTGSGTACYYNNYCEIEDERCIDGYCTDEYCDTHSDGSARDGTGTRCRQECIDEYTIRTCDCQNNRVIEGAEDCEEGNRCENNTNIGAQCVEELPHPCEIYPEGDPHRAALSLTDGDITGLARTEFGEDCGRRQLIITEGREDGHKTIGVSSTPSNIQHFGFSIGNPRLLGLERCDDPPIVAEMCSSEGGDCLVMTRGTCSATIAIQGTEGRDPVFE
ncbi:hypothetical protein KKF81_06415 [Candidatus Micrarchaeota archaeon]|nr:hypothetical protein [Candidatus Micrarchaeota archaeon]MBU1166562.1 hypothetical protein [Candidatus Micrarchaeota archaeon]MBU1887003.1 hypothetical protein [Candidatus Micrarchaeota archaeon]